MSDLCFAARALAQSHPMTEVSHRYKQECFADERRRQPASELADWAGTALMVGYCLRRAEEQQVTKTQQIPEKQQIAARERASTVGVEREDDGFDVGTGAAAAGEVDADAVADLSEALRSGDAGRVTLLQEGVTVAALDRIIATELDKRREHLREQLDDEAWSELEDYISWWVIHGYALRASERPSGRADGPQPARTSRGAQ